MRVIGYLRVSTDEQARSGLGLEAQRFTISRYADLMGWEVEWMGDEGRSGKDMARPGLAAALDALQKGEAQALVTAKLDRLSRSVADFAGLLDRARKEKWAVVALDLSLDTTTITGELVANILMACAQWERRLIGQRTSDAIQARLLKGEDWGRRATLTETTEAAIRDLHADGLTAHAISRILNEQDVPTARGGAWHPSTVQRVLRRIERRAKASAA